jgi:hypothetical protein
MQTLNQLEEAHPHEGMLSTLPTSSIQMLSSLENTLTDTPRNPGHSVCEITVQTKSCFQIYSDVSTPPAHAIQLGEGRLFLGLKIREKGQLFPYPALCYPQGYQHT